MIAVLILLPVLARMWFVAETSYSNVRIFIILRNLLQLIKP